MTANNPFYSDLFNGLKALAEYSFPKKCANCGQTYETADQFLAETQALRASTSGLKESEEEDGTKIIEVFRNCQCGSTMMEFFGDRRDLSEKGLQRRQKFEEIMDFLDKNGLDRQVARAELLKVMRGEKSDTLSKMIPQPKNNGQQK
ncbi:MAG: oxidoreductase [Gammaproteobacteria bacterium]|nr:oxidoreductase [Gammaproteobacteria bacterium]